MLSRILDIINVRPDERKQVLLLLGKGFFLGIFLVTYVISAEALFLNSLSHLLKEALLVSGGLGMITTAIYSFLQTRISFGKLVVGNLLLIFIVTATMYGLFFTLDESFKEYVIFGMFALIGPVTAIILLGFWGVFGRLFDLRQSKRIIGWIDTGQLTAAILATISIPLLGAYIPETVDYLLISAGSILVAVIFSIVITIKFNLSSGESGADQKSKKLERTSFRLLFKDNYVVLLSMFLLFSMVTFTFVQFSFQTVASLQYPSENELRDFLATFHLGYLILSFIMQTFVNDKIIGVYGLKVALFILPTIVGVFTICAIASGLIFGYEPNSENTFIWFFLFISISRLFNFSIRDALENPTFKLFFMPLDSNKRFDIQTKVEGVVNETSRMIAGVAILALSLVSFFELIHYSYAVVFLIAGYLFFIGKLYNQYRNKIKLKLESQAAASDSINERISMSRSLESSLVDSSPEKAIFLFRLLEKIDPNAVGSSINKLMRHKSESIREYAQSKLNEIKGLSVSDKYVIKFEENSDEREGRKLVEGLDLEGLLSSGNITKKRISKLSKSDNFEDRLYAAELLGNSTDNENISFLIELLSDVNYGVRTAAIQAAEKSYNDEIINALVNNLSQPMFSNRAMSALVKMGGKALTGIDTTYYRTGQSTQTMVKILQIYGRVGGNKSIKLLWSKIDYPDKVLVSQVLISLGECGFKAGIAQVSRIKFAIESDISDVAWNIAAIGEVSTDGHGNALIQSIKRENHYDLEHIYMLLGMLYDAKSIQLVKENIESGTTEGVTYAIELLDVFLSDDLKQKVIPLLDDLSEAEKSKKLEIFFPRAALDGNTVLKFLINRDFNQTNRWVKSCAIYQIGFFKLKGMSLDVIANLFNPDELVQQISAWSLFQISPELYEEHTLRIDRKMKASLDKMIVPEVKDSSKVLKYDVIHFLKGIQVFNKVEGLVLASLADNLSIITLGENEIINLGSSNVENFYIVYAGVAQMRLESGITKDVIQGQFIGEYVLSEDESLNSIVTKSDVMFLEISKDKFYELLSDDISFADKVVSYF